MGSPPRTASGSALTVPMGMGTALLAALLARVVMM